MHAPVVGDTHPSCTTGSGDGVEEEDAVRPRPMPDEAVGVEWIEIVAELEMPDDTAGETGIEFANPPREGDVRLLPLPLPPLACSVFFSDIWRCKRSTRARNEGKRLTASAMEPPKPPTAGDAEMEDGLEVEEAPLEASVVNEPALDEGEAELVGGYGEVAPELANVNALAAGDACKLPTPREAAGDVNELLAGEGDSTKPPTKGELGFDERMRSNSSSCRVRSTLKAAIELDTPLSLLREGLGSGGITAIDGDIGTEFMTIQQKIDENGQFSCETFE